LLSRLGLAAHPTSAGQSVPVVDSALTGSYEEDPQNEIEEEQGEEEQSGGEE